MNTTRLRSAFAPDSLAPASVFGSVTPTTLYSRGPSMSSRLIDRPTGSMPGNSTSAAPAPRTATFSNRRSSVVVIARPRETTRFCCGKKSGVTPSSRASSLRSRCRTTRRDSRAGMAETTVGTVARIRPRSASVSP